MSKQPSKEQEDKKHRAIMVSLHNRITSQFSFGKVKTWKDVYGLMGMSPGDMPDGNEGTLTFPELKGYLAQQKTQLEERLSGTYDKAAKKDETVSRTEQVSKPEVRLPEKSSEKQLPIPQVAKSEPTQELGSSDDYGWSPSPNEPPPSSNFFHYWFQKRGIAEAMDAIIKEKKQALLVLGTTGSGKTRVAAGVVRRLVDMKFANDATFGSTLYLYITRATVVEQTKRVFKKYNLGMKQGVEILNIEQLRSRAGNQWVTEKMDIIDGVETYTWKWRKMLNPVVILWDECQALKNEGSTQHKIAVAFNDVETPTLQIFISATPFTKVAEAKCFAVATRKNISDVMMSSHQSYLSNSTWPTYSQAVAGSQSTPYEHNEAAMERLTKDLEPYIIRLKGIRPQFGADNKVEMINFQSDEAIEYYRSAYERWLKQKAEAAAKAAQTGQKESGLDRLTRDLKFRMAAEYIRYDIIGERMYNDVNTGGLAAVAALGFKGSVIGIVKYLIEKKGVSRDDICLVWGGGKTNVTKNEQAALDVVKQADKLMAAGISQDEIFKMLDIEPEDLVRAQEKEAEVLPPEYRLGPQSKEERQREIDRFQSGKALYCLFTMRAGGVGLSLHHSDEFSPVKCGRKESGYAYEEDIPLVPIRPRRTYVAPTYSAIELVQSLGRCPRLTSLSETEQILLFYRGTIEVEVANITKTKLGCLGKVVRQKEDWMDILDSQGASAKNHLSDDSAPVDPDDLETGEEEE